MLNTRRLLVLALLAFPPAGPAAAADTDVTLRRLPAPPGWSEDRLRRVRPMPLPGLARPFDAARVVSDRLSTRTGGGSAAFAPRRAPRPDFDHRLLPAGSSLFATSADSRRAPGPSTKDRGIVWELDYTTSRLLPEDARVLYPYSTVGLLIFSAGEELFACSASVISSRVVLTAAHCVFSPGFGFFSDFLFIPAYHEGNDPFGAWTANLAAVPAEWSDGDGILPHAADFGLLVLDDLDGEKIGDVTGWLGFLPDALLPNQVKMIGYSANLDRGEVMQQIDAGQSLLLDPLPAAIYGSNFESGSSGSPWVMNFGVKAKGQKGGQNKAANRIVGLSSFGPNDRREKVQGSSLLSSVLRDVFDDVCADAAGNCKKKGKPNKPRR